MGSCYSGDHIAGDHIHTDKKYMCVTLRNHNRSTALVSNRLLRGGDWGVGLFLNMSFWTQKLRGYGYVQLRLGGGGIVRRMGTQQQQRNK